MRLIYKQPVNAQLLKGNHIILSVIGLQLFKPCFQPALGTLQLLDGKTFAAAGFHLRNALGDFCNLLLKKSFLTLLADGNTLKLGVANDDCVIVAGGNPGTELFTPMGFKVLFGSHKDVGGGI